jgi:8-oxo-dGTP diphosphatase
MHLFTADGYEGTLSDCDEGTLEWVPDEQLTSLPIWEGDKVFLRLLTERESFFSLKLVYEGERLVRATLDGQTELI